MALDSFELGGNVVYLAKMNLQPLKKTFISKSFINKNNNILGYKNKKKGVVSEGTEKVLRLRIPF